MTCEGNCKGHIGLPAEIEGLLWSDLADLWSVPVERNRQLHKTFLYTRAKVTTNRIKDSKIMGGNVTCA